MTVVNDLATAAALLKADAEALHELVENGGSGGGEAPFTTKTANYTAVAGDRINADTSGGSFTITLPASAGEGGKVTIAAPNRSWRTNPLTVARTGADTIDGIADSQLCDVPEQITYLDDPDDGWVTFKSELLFPIIV
jgi:hypothetical protein